MFRFVSVWLAQCCVVLCLSYERAKAANWTVDGHTVDFLNIATGDFVGYMEHLSGCGMVMSSTLHGEREALFVME